MKGSTQAMPAADRASWTARPAMGNVCSSATITARWTFEDGQVVDERTETISPSGDAYTTFFITQPGGLPAGKYTLSVLLNGAEAQKKEFEVK